MVKKIDGFSITPGSPAPVLPAHIEPSVMPLSWRSNPDRVFVSNSPESVVCLIDADDHFSFRASLPGLAVRTLESRLQQISGELDAQMTPAYNEEFGFLTSNVFQCGEGVAASILLHLPALARSGLFERVIKSVLADGLSVQGFYGTAEGSAGDLWILSSGEDGGYQRFSLENSAVRIALAEEKAMEDLELRSRLDLLDSTGRAFGMMSYAFKLSESESLSILSDLRLGTLTATIGGIDAKVVGQLLTRMGALSIGGINAAPPTSIPEPNSSRRGGMDAMRAEVLRFALAGAFPSDSRHDKDAFLQGAH